MIPLLSYLPIIVNFAQLRAKCLAVQVALLGYVCYSVHTLPKYNVF
jgi:hypothetical protein